MPFKITKEHANEILLELAKEFRKQNGRNKHVEMIIVGGGSILLNYGFRDFTDDFDYMARDSRALQDAAIKVGEKYDLDYHWINSDFMTTDSYSAKLYRFSSHYKTFNNGSFEVRTVKGEYLIAMKAVAMRWYKTDASDILGILICEARDGNKIGAEQVEQAYRELYGDRPVDQEIWEKICQWCEADANDLIAEYEKTVDYQNYYEDVVRTEARKTEAGLSVSSIEKIIIEARKKREAEENAKK